MSVAAENSDNNIPEKNNNGSVDKSGGEAYNVGSDEDMWRRFDRSGTISPLSSREQQVLSDLSSEEAGLFQTFEEFNLYSATFTELVQGEILVSKSDQARQQGSETWEAVAAALCDSFVLTLKEMQQFCDSQTQFLGFATHLIHQDVNKRAERLSVLFDDEDDSFPTLTHKRARKQVSKYAAFANTDEDTPEYIGDYFEVLLAEDMVMIRKLMKNVYRDQDLRDIKDHMLRACELLEELRSRYDSEDDNCE